MPDFDSYLSPFSWRYGTPAMRHLWSETNKRLLWRKIWVTLAEIQTTYGIVSPEQAGDLRAHMSEVNIARALEIENEVQHDLMAEVQVFAGQSPLGGGILHLGATSADIEDNAETLRLRSGLGLLLRALTDLLDQLSHLIEQWAATPVMAFTHLQPAEPTTLGYRLAMYGQDLLRDHQLITELANGIHGKGFKGAVGTSAAYAEILGQDKLADFEAKISQALDLPFFLVTSQVYPRKQDYEVICALAGLGASLYKFAFDLRLLQSPPIGELAEPFSEGQIGSSAMPFKRNPIRSEKINSLARYLASLPHIAWDNAAHSLLERTLDDSANRRILLPEAFLAADELLRTAKGILSKLHVDECSISRNLAIYGPFAATEPLLMALVKAGADRQEMHARIRTHALKAWNTLAQGGENPLVNDLSRDAELLEYLSAQQMLEALSVGAYTGDAAQRARKMAENIRAKIKGTLHAQDTPPGVVANEK